MKITPWIQGRHAAVAGALAAIALLGTFGHIVVQASEEGPKRYATAPRK